MADSTVYMPGIVLASVMFQHLNTDSDVEGFILGESKEEERRAITDSANDHVYYEHKINIKKHITCNKINKFYNGAGEVNLNIIRNILTDNMQENLIGWYRQRRNTDQQMTLREKLVHENLKNALSNPKIVFLLLTPSEMTSVGSTHEMEYAVFSSSERHFYKVPILVTNLGSLEDVVYRTSCVPCSATGYNRVIQKHKSEFFTRDGSQREVIEINKMNNSMQSELQKECMKVEQSEQEVQKLLAQLTTLRKIISKKKSLISEKDKGVVMPTSRRNMLLNNALKKRFAFSPLFQTQTLTIQGIPVLEPHTPPLTFTCQHIASDPEPIGSH